MSKLVRDKVKDVLADKQVEFRNALPGDRKSLLSKKLLEEVGELIFSHNSESVRQEAADVIEVVLSLAEAYGVGRMEVSIEVSQKREGRGGYDNLVVMDFVDARPSPAVGSSLHSRDYFRFDGPGYSG